MHTNVCILRNKQEELELCIWSQHWKKHWKITQGPEWQGSISAEKDMGVLVGEKLDITQQCALAAKQAKNHLMCNRRFRGPGLVIFPLDSGIHFWVPWQRKHAYKLQQVQRRVPRLSRTEACSSWREAKGAQIVQPGENMALGEPNSSHPEPTGGYQKGRERLFMVVHGGRVRNNRHKLKQYVGKRSSIDLKKKYLHRMNWCSAWDIWSMKLSWDLSCFPVRQNTVNPTAAEC